MTKHFKNHKQAIWYVAHDIWELCNKPHRFFNTLEKILEDYHENDDMMNRAYLSGSLEDSKKELEKLKKAFINNRKQSK